MKLKSLALTTGIAVSGIIASGAFTPAQAFSFFFGEDTGASIQAIPYDPFTTVGIGMGPRLNSIAEEVLFHSNLTSYGTENFEGFNDFDTPTSINFPGAGSANVTSTVGTVYKDPFEGRFAISGNNYYEVNDGSFVINFAKAVSAFGFYGTDIGDFNGQLTLTLNDAANTVLTVPNTINGLNGSALYYGFIASNPGQTFTSISFGNTNSDFDVFAFDDISVQFVAVPEPFTVIGTLIGGTAAFRMRKKLKSSTKA